MASQKDVKNRIASVKNVQKITRAMEMVAAARLRKAEQRVQALRPYASAIRRMTRQAAEAAESIPNLPILKEREVGTVGILIVAGDRGLAGAFNSQILRAGLRVGEEHERQGKKVLYYAAGRRVNSSLTFRKKEVTEAYEGFTDRPAYADARDIAQDLVAAYVDGKVDRVELFYNAFKSAASQEVTRETLLPLQQADILADDPSTDEDDPKASGDGKRSLVEYEPDPQEILTRLIPDYVEISVYRALLDSSASEHGARMTAMRNASENAGELVKDLTLDLNRARQAEITQEIMEVVAGAESV
jgi:F-type H+-transporting ATPase subunit gamma